MKFNTKLLETLVCPVGKDRFLYNKKKQELVSKKSKLVYKIENGVPILIPDQAKLTD